MCHIIYTLKPALSGIVAEAAEAQQKDNKNRHIMIQDRMKMTKTDTGLPPSRTSFKTWGCFMCLCPGAPFLIISLMGAYLSWI